MPTIETSVLPGTLNLEGSVNADFLYEAYLEDVADDGTATPIDVSDGSWAAQIRFRPGITLDPPLASFTVTEDDDSTPGLLLLHVDAATMSSLNAGHTKRKLFWDLRQGSADRYWLAGEFVILPRVTQ